MNVKITAESK